MQLASGRVALVVLGEKQSLLKPKMHVFWSMYSQREVKLEALALGDSFCTDSITGAEDTHLWQNVDLNRIWALKSA